MSLMQRWILSATAALAFGVGVAPCDAATATSQTSYSHDRFGNLTGAVVIIQTDHSAWRFVLTGRFLDLPVAAQVDRLDRQFNLGADKDLVSQLLDNMQQSRQQAAQQAALQRNLDQINQQNQQIQQQQQLQRQLDQINRNSQPPFIPPPPFIPVAPVIPRIP